MAAQITDRVKGARWLALCVAMLSHMASADVAVVKQEERIGPDIDSLGFHGYMRSGAGASNAGPQACYGLGDNTMKYRLGNECDSYFEGGQTWGFAPADADGVEYTGTLWINQYTPGSHFGSDGSRTGIAKAYIEAKNLSFLNGGIAWVGSRYYYRPDIHMLDLQYINMNGTGGGFDRINAGPGKFSYAVFKDNDNARVYVPSTNSFIATTAAVRQNFVYQDLPVNPGGKLDIGVTVVSAQGKDKKGGVQLSLFHNQSVLKGNGGNTIGVQYGTGAAAFTGGGQIGSTGSTTSTSGVKRTRVFDHLWIQPTPNFGAEIVALWQQDKGDASLPVAFGGGTLSAPGKSTWTSLGIRPSYAFSKHVKLVSEIGADRVTSPSGGPSEQLTKVTLAPTLSMGPGLWARPELRFYVTYAKWNDAARAAVNAANVEPDVFGTTATNGTSVGVQLEAWW